MVYHIYPRSLQDSNSDGVGDLPGIISRLDYIQGLGANALWISPFYPSPMADFGYDVADYCAVDPVFGTMDDFKRLLHETHARDMKLLIDLIPNHTSDEHAWFQQSRISHDNPYADWYVWHDPLPGSPPDAPMPPNNWRDVLSGGSAWEWVPERRQFYLHSFNIKQPDLNWSNPNVRQAIKQVMRFWLDLGVDGFRVDAVYWMGKEPLLSNDHINPDYVEGKDVRYNALLHDNSRGWPVVYAYLAEMADVLKEEPYTDQLRFMVTEAYPERHTPVAAYMNFYVGVDPKVAAPFNFEGLMLPWEAAPWRRFLRSFHEALRRFDPCCVASYSFGNHDHVRLASRLGDAAARSAAVMSFTLPGMIFVYYGDEIGMKNVPLPPPKVHDPAAHGGHGRDPERTPMQWSPGKHAGFSDGDSTWLPIASDYTTYNVETETSDPRSTLTLYRRLGTLRNKTAALRKGEMSIVEVGHVEVLAYIRTKDEERYGVVVNFSSEEVLCHPQFSAKELVISSNPDRQTSAPTTSHGLTLAPHEAVVFRLRV